MVLGAQIIKDFKIKNMILFQDKKKNYWVRGIWVKNKKTNNYKMKKILIINANYYKEITEKIFSIKKIKKKKKN